MQKTQKYILTLLLLICSLSLMAADIKIAQQGSGTYSLNQPFNIIIDMSDIKNSVQMPDVPGCRIVSNMYSASSQVMADGSGRPIVKQSKVITLTVEPIQTGSFRFGPLTAGGIRSNTISYTISGAGSSNSPQPSTATSAITDVNDVASNEDIIIHATVSNKTPYVQQGIRYDVKLYLRTNIASYPQLDYPKFENCTYELLPDNSSHTLKEVSLNGKRYMSLDLYSMIVYPSKAGKITIQGAKNTVPITPFDNITVMSNDVELDVKPLPDLEDHNEINGTGAYTVSAEALSSMFRTNEVGKIKFTVEGTGNPSFVSMPDIADFLPKGIKLLKSESVIDKNPGADGVKATVTFECSVIPSATGEFEIPAVTFTFFDPTTGQWYTRSTKPFNIDVKQGSQVTDDADELTFNSELQQVDSHSNKSSYIISELWYWLIYLILVIALIAAISVYRKRLALHADTRLLNHKKANRMARRRLRTAEVAMKKENHDLFYDELLKALWGYLGDKLAMPTSDLTRGNISEELLKAGVSQITIQDTIAFIDECEFAKYASASGSDMPQAYSTAVKLLNQLETEIQHVFTDTQTTD